MRKKLAMLITSLFLVLGTAWAQAPVATAEEAITGLLNRIGGNGAADKFEIVIDASLAENGKDVFVITSQNGKPCIKGNTQLSVATGINWYLNHYAHINLTWNNLTTDLSQVTLPVPGGEEKHVCNAPYRYDFNTCTFSYSMAFWTWERWQQEIDWMALHGINAPLNLVGLDVVTRKFLRELGVSENDINAYIAGPGFIAWFAMNNLEGWGGTINSPSTGVDMSGNPDWWYTRQEQLCRNMLQRMRELGMQPVIPGFSGQVPNCIVNYTIDGFSSGDVVNNGTWAGGYTRPDILKPNTESYRTFAAVYYKHLHEVMGVSELYSIDPFHEGSLPSGVTNATCYPNIMVELDKHFGNVEQSVKDSYKVTKSPSWIIQYWQGVPQSGAFTAMKNAGYTSRFIGLDLFADNIYADNAAKWRTNYYDTCPYIYCMLHNFGGRSGLHGRLETTMDGYFQALAKNNNCQGIGATPEGTETNPILYDMLFELPWMNSNPGADAWLAEYAHSRYGVDSKTAPAALEALKNLKKSVWDCKVNQQGTSEAVILARPDWTVGSVSSWSTSAIYWDTQDVLQAADKLYSVKEAVTANGGQDGIANYNYDFIDVVRQAMVDYAAELLPLINAARGDDAEYTRLYQLYLQLMLDLDEMLSYDENFKLERWTSLARNIADEVDGTTENDRNWLEWNARTQVTVWSKGNTDLHDYSNRCWAGLIKDFHYKRWEKFFTTKGGSFDGGWFSGFEYPWTVDFNETYNLAGDYSQVVIPDDMTATEKAAETFGNYFGRIKGATKNYIFPMGVATKATKSDVIPEVYRGQTVDLPLVIGKNVTISSVWVDLNNDGAKGNGETLTATNNQVAIPAEVAIGKTTAQVVYSDGTDITFNLALVEDITANRTVTAVAGANGSVAIEGTNELSISTTEAVKMTATANTGYNFKDWTDANGNVVSNDNPYIYYGKEAATFTANFIQDKWGVPTEDKGDWSDATVKTSYVNEITFAYRNREPETIYEASETPDNLFNTVSQIVNVPQGASFDVTWSDDNNNGLKYCCLSAYIDLNADGDFTDEGELLKVAGTKGAQNTDACEGKINVVLPYDAPLGITHMRIRFDGAWKDNGYNASTKSYDAKAQLNRMCYEVVINVTEESDKAATINVETNNAAWGTVEVWTDETPDGSTGTEWSVSANIPMYLRATKASDDVEFLGWYDHYGRLLSENLEHTMYAREDATYTARFRKALEIDGWQFEYRTEPSDEIITTKLANGVKPEVGKTYYIYAPTRPTNDGEYVNRYLYNNSGTLTLNTTESTAASYLWVCGIEDGKYTFQNVADPAKYLKHKGLANAPYGFELGTGTTYYEGITLQSVPGDGETRNLFFVINDNGSGFNQSTRAHNQSTEDYTTDFVFTEVSAPEVVVLTGVRKSGDHDLVIPETVEILGEQCKVVGFDNNLFNNNKDLWSISLPSTIEEMSNNKVFNAVVKGKGANASADAGNYITTDLGNTLTAAEDWSISLTIEDNGNNFNQWGSALIATGNAPMNDTYGKGFQLYLQAGGGLVVKTDANNDANKLTNLTKGTKFRIDVVYTHANTQLKVTATPLIAIARNTPTSASLIVTQDMSNFSVVSHAIPEGVNITNLEVRKGEAPDPFQGCTNLLGIEIADGCEEYYVADGTLYRTGGVELHELADENKEDAIRTLGALIDNTKALMDVIATSINPTGKATGLPLTTGQGEDFYVSSNADQNTGGGSNDGGGIAALVDNNEGTYFHTRWGGTVVNEPHYIQVDLGANNLMNYFKFTYKPRNGSPAPTTMTVYGSNDGVTFTDVLATINSGLPAHNSGNTYESAAIDSKKYRYLRFTVTGSAGPGNAQYGNQYFFGMLEFDLFKLTSTVEVVDEYKELGGITNDEAANVYDNLVNALFVYGNGGTSEELMAAYNVLEPLYNALNAKKNRVPYILAINELAAATNELMDVIAEINPAGKSTEIELSATEGDPNYIWCNAPTNEGVGNLLDGQDGTILHTSWGGTVNAYDHYLLVSLDVADLSNFAFRYKARTGSTDDMNYADIPSGIKVYGSKEKDGEYTELYTVSGLTQSSGYDWTSPAIESDLSYRYLRFNVTANRGFWHMAEFDLYKLVSTVEDVAPEYQEIGGITIEEAKNAYDKMHEAQALCGNGTAEELETALNELQTMYDELNAKKDKVTYAHKLEELNELAAATDDLMTIIAAEIDPVGKATEIELQATAEGEDYYIWCSNPYNGSNAGDKAGGVAALLDEDPDTYLHTDYDNKSATNDYLQVELGSGNELIQFKIEGTQRKVAEVNIPKTIEVQGSTDKSKWETITTINNLPQTPGASWKSENITTTKKYPYLRFIVTTEQNNIFFHLAEFDLFKLTSEVEVASGYKGLAGITDEEATTAYDLMAEALFFCNTGGTLDELNTLYDALKASYDAINAKQAKVLNGYYHIDFINGETAVPMFIGYNEVNDDWVGDDHKGYKILGMGEYTTTNEADKVFAIIPQENGYAISAQGKYLKAIDFNAWKHIQFSDDENAAGLYLFHETSLAGAFKIQGAGERDDDEWNVHNDYLEVYHPENAGLIVGPNPENKASSFTFTPATTYKVTISDNGILPLYLPFNVVLPENVTAYDITATTLNEQALLTGEGLMAEVAKAGDILKAGTPVILKGFPGHYTLNITMNDEDAKTSSDGSVLRGTYVNKTLSASDSYKTFVFDAENKRWKTITDETSEVLANSCWIEANIDADEISLDIEVISIENTDWKIRYVPTTNDGIKLTDAVVNDEKSGVLEIPSEVTIDGETKKIVAISSDFMHDNTALTSVTIPATMTNLGFRDLEPMFEGSYKGEPGDYGVFDGPELIEGQGHNRCYEFPIDPVTRSQFVVTKESAWKLTLDVNISNPDASFNNYGSSVVSTLPNSLADSYIGGHMQIYLRKGNKEITVKIDNADDRYMYTLPVLDNEGNETGELVAHDHFKFELEHDGYGGYQVVIYYDDGRAKMYNISASAGNHVADFSRLYYSLPEGIKVDVKFEKLVSQGLFVGCTNLHEIIVDENNPTFKSCEHGVLYDKNGYYVMRIPEGETSHHFDIPSKVVKLYAGAIHGVTADIVLHSNPQIGVVEGHDKDVENAKFYLSLDDIDNTITAGEQGYGGARNFTSANANTYLAARYKRAPLAEGKFGTFMLPFVPENALNKYDFFELKAVSDGTLTFTQVYELKPKTPYLYRLKEYPTESTELEGDKVFGTDESGNDVFETNTTFTVEALDKFAHDGETELISLGAYVNGYVETKNHTDSYYYAYSANDGLFHRVTKKLNYRPYRAFFVWNPKQGQAAPARLRMRVVEGDGTTTEIDPSQIEGWEEDVYYDLQGRRVLNPTNGIYIVNGRKVVIE